MEFNDIQLKYTPNSIEAEQSVLGSMLLEPRCIPEVVELLSPDDFYLQQNRDIYESIYRMFTMSMSIDVVTVLEQMRQNGTYDEDTTRNYVLQIGDITPTAANVMEYAAIVKEKATSRRLLEAATKIIEAIHDNTPASDAIDFAEQQIYSVRKDNASKGLVHVSVPMQDVYQKIEDAAANKGTVPGLSTGLSDLDRAISGLNKSDLIYLAARPGMGKTSLSMNILRHVGQKSGMNVAFFSLEMSSEQLVTRLLSNEAFIDNKRLITGDIDLEDWGTIAIAGSAICQSNIYISDDPMSSVADMLAKCRRLGNLGLVVIDYLQLMQSAGTGKGYAGENRQQVVSDISRSLKIMAKELNVPVLCLSQLSRSCETRSDKRPMLSDLRESGSIEQDADIVLFIYRDDYYNKDSDVPNQAEIIIGKNRHGETGRIMVQWMPEYTTFCGLDRTHEEQ